MPNWKKVVTSGSNARLNAITMSGNIIPNQDNTHTLGTSANRFLLNGGTPVTVTGSGNQNYLARFSGSTEIQNSNILSTDTLTSIQHTNDGNQIFVVSGSNGELLSVTDEVGDELLRVNDTSGIGVFIVSSSGTINAERLTASTQDFVLTYDSASGDIFFQSASIIRNESGVISSSAQIADDISGSLSATAIADLGARITSGAGNFVANEFIVAVGKNAITSSDALAVDSSGNLGIGTASPEVRLHMSGDGPQTAQIRLEQFNDTTDAPDIRTRRARGTAASPSDVQTGDYLFRLNVEGRDGGSNITYASQQFDVDSDDQDALNYKLETRDTDGTLAVRYKIDGSGNHEFTGSLDLSGSLTAHSATVDNFTINDTLTATTVTGSLLRLSENGSGLRLTNVGGFEPQSGTFNIFGNNDVTFGAGGSGAGERVLTLVESNRHAQFEVAVSASVFSGSFVGDGSQLTGISDTQLSNEEVQDIVGSMVTGNSESGITVTYQDADGTLDFSVASQTDQNFTTALKNKLDGIETSADVTDTDNVEAAGALMDSEVTNLAQVKAFDSSDYATAAQGGLADSAQQPPSEGAFVDGDKTKLDGIEAGADVTDTTNVVAALTAGTNISIAGNGTISSTDTNTQLSDEEIQDIVGGMVTGNSESGITVTYQDGDGTLDFSVASQTDENFTSALKTKLDGIATSANNYSHPTFDGDDISIDTGALTGATVISDLDFNITTNNQGHVTDANATVATRDLTLANLGYTGDTDANNYSLPEATATVRGGIELFSNTDQSVAANSVSSTAGRTYGIQLNSAGQAVVNVPWTDTNTNTQLSNEQVQDIVGGMVTGNSESGITVTYQDADGTLDFSVASQTDQNFTTALKNKLDGIENSADVTDTTNVVAALTAGSNVTIESDGTINSTDTNTQLSTEAVQDIVGAMFTGNTETRISATYQDGDGTIDLVVTDQSYTLPEATATTRGGIELFSNTDQSVAANSVSSTAGRTYGIQLNSAGQAVVNVPWTDTDTNTDTDVSVSNLETRLGQINSNVSIGTVADAPTVTIPGDLVVTGTTTTNNVETVSTSNGVVFEGNAADSNELTLLAGTLSADRTITLPNATGTVALTNGDYTNLRARATTKADVGLSNVPNSDHTAQGYLTAHPSITEATANLSNSGRTYIQSITLDSNGHVTAVSTGTETVTNTNTMGDGFVLEDGDGTEVTITENKEVKFKEGAGININWTDTSNGTDGDPYDLTFGVDGVLQDLDTLGAPTADGQFIVATGAGAFQYESAATARTSLGLGSAATLGTAAVADGGASLATGDQIHAFVTGLGYTANTGTVTSVGITTSAGLDGSGTITTTGTVNISLDLSELTNMTADVVGSADQLILLDNGAERKKAINEIKLGQFNNDQGWTSNVGDITGVTAGTGLSGGGSSGGVTLNLDFSELTDMTGDISGTTEFILQNGSTESRKAASEIKLSNFNNDSGWTSNVGDITAVTAGVGLSGGGSSGGVTLTLDMSELTDMTATMVGTDEFIVLDSGADRRKAANEIGLSIFNNDSGFATGDNFDADGTFASLRAQGTTAGDVGLGNVTNESKATMFTSPTFTGDVTVPSKIIHTGDTNTYIQFHDADQFRVVTGGSERFEVNNSTITLASSDVRINEYLYHNGDTNTYLRFLADQLQLAAGGRNVIQMDEGTDPDKVVLGDSSTETYTEGKMAIGTSATDATLHVSGASDVLLVEGSGSTVFEVQGSEGQLFSITDDLSGDLFSVSDISGIPLFNVNASDESYFTGQLEVQGLLTGSSVEIAGSGSFEHLTVQGLLTGSSVEIAGSGSFEHLTVGSNPDTGDAVLILDTNIGNSPYPSADIRFHDQGSEQAVIKYDSNPAESGLLIYVGSQKVADFDSNAVNFPYTITVNTIQLDNSSDRSGLLLIDNNQTSANWSGIQTTNNSGQLWSVMGNNADFGIYDDTNNEWALLYNINGGVELYHNGSKKVETASGGIVVTGAITATGDITAYYSSDKRLKENIKPIENATEKIKKIGGYEFDWKPNDNPEMIHEGHDIGVIAQEVEEVLPEIVQDRENGYKAVEYQKLVALLIESNKELAARVEELENKLK